MSRFSDEHFGANEDEVIESLQEEFADMKKTARTHAARCRKLEGLLHRALATGQLDAVRNPKPPHLADEIRSALNRGAE